KKAGYGGLLVLIDELVNIYKIPNSITRQYNYEKLLAMYNDTLQGKAKYLGIFMGGTPKCVEDERRGVFSYEALKSRLEESRFHTENIKDMLAPIIKLTPLTYEEMYVLIEKLALIHSELFEYQLKITQEDMIHFIKIEFGRIGTDINITPREVIRDFIVLLNMVYQNPELTICDILNSSGFEFTKNNVSDETVHKEFEEFIL
ncbi:MAG: biotin carboxylase, partial [Clostridia bacterium]|nr:biotin carboxylase [Clostridia bacterium]